MDSLNEPDGGRNSPSLVPSLTLDSSEKSQGGADSRLQAQDSRAINLPGLGRGLNLEGTCHQTQEEEEVQPDPLAPVRWPLEHKLCLDRAQVEEEQLEAWLWAPAFFPARASAVFLNEGTS